MAADVSPGQIAGQAKAGKPVSMTTASSPTHQLPEKGMAALPVLSVSLLLCCVLVAGAGLYLHSGGEPATFTNLYGDAVRIYGKGLYKNDSFFRAPIFRGTDFTMLTIVCPLLLTAIFINYRRRTEKTRLLLISAITCVGYYAANVAFGVIYNSFHLAYILLLSLSFFSLVIGMRSIRLSQWETSAKGPLPYKGFTVFLVLTGIALFVAWLPDILAAMKAGRPLLLIEHYTTEVTYVLDMGLIAPTCFVCAYLLKKRKGLGYVLLDMLLTLCIVIGIMLPVQTVFQARAGIVLPVPVMITKIATFCLLALFAVYFKWRLLKSVSI